MRFSPFGVQLDQKREVDENRVWMETPPSLKLTLIGMYLYL